MLEDFQKSGRALRQNNGKPHAKILDFIDEKSIKKQKQPRKQISTRELQKAFEDFDDDAEEIE